MGLDAPSRRRFLLAASSAAGAALAGPVAARDLIPAGPRTSPGSSDARAVAAYRLRLAAASAQLQLGAALHPNNGDEDLYPTHFASFSKGLVKDSLGVVQPLEYTTLLRALTTGSADDFEDLHIGGTHVLTNPQGGLAFEMVSPDSQCLTQPPPPAFASAEEAAEIAENYWMALLRDTDFEEYDFDSLAADAANDLSTFSDFRGLKEGGRVTAGTLFRGPFPGCENGPAISQFLWLDTPFGAEEVNRQMKTNLPGSDFLTSYADWRAVQEGYLPPRSIEPKDPIRRYIRNGRDLSVWVHRDILYQAYFNAMLILFDLEAPFDPDNPYRASQTQMGFATFGPPHISSILAAVAKPALEAVWFQKWYIHRRLRPEEFAGRVHNHATRAAEYPIHGDLLRSTVLDRLHSKHGTYLLPMAFPEGCPTHPSYGAGHATVAGACVTILKAFFEEPWVIPEPVVPSPDGTYLLGYLGPDLTVGGELNKLAWNIAAGRNMAGVHWRSDAVESLLLGEEIAIRYLREQNACFHEEFAGFGLTKFDGTVITV